MASIHHSCELKEMHKILVRNSEQNKHQTLRNQMKNNIKIYLRESKNGMWTQSTSLRTRSTLWLL
jgi:hypothetical protein